MPSNTGLSTVLLRLIVVAIVVIHVAVATGNGNPLNLVNDGVVGDRHTQFLRSNSQQVRYYYIILWPVPRVLLT